MTDGDHGGPELDAQRRRASERAAEAELRHARARAAGEPAPVEPPRFSRLAAVAPVLLIAALAALLTSFALTERDSSPQIGQELGEVPATTATQAAAISARRQPALASAPRAERELPGRAEVAAARRYAAERGGLVSFAAIDSRGRMIGEAADRRFVSASIVKSLLLVAELRRLDREGAPLDSETRSLLESMITFSDNDAADAIYARVGDEGIAEVAKAYGMTRIRLGGYWASTYVTAADMARMFSDLEPPIPADRREFALGLLGSIIPEQSWGIPAAAAADPTAEWSVRFKGGWRSTGLGELANQAAELRDGDRRLAIAVLTDGQPTFEESTETVEGVAARLLGEVGGEDSESPRSSRRDRPGRGAPAGS